MTAHTSLVKLEFSEEISQAHQRMWLSRMRRCGKYKVSTNHWTQNEQVHEEHNSIMLNTGRRKRVTRLGSTQSTRPHL